MLGQEIAQAFIKIRPDATGFESAVRQQTNAPLQSISKAAAGIVTGAALLGFLKEGIDKLGEMEKVAAQTSVALKATGGQANVTGSEITGMAQAIQDYSGKSRESVQAGENILLSFKSIRNGGTEASDIFDRATKSAADLAVSTGQDVPAAAAALGKALDAPANASRALRGLNIILTQSEKDQVTALVQNGQQWQAQALLLDQVQSRVGGAAAAYGETLPGKLERAQNSLKDTAAVVAGVVAPALESVADFSVKAGQDFATLPQPLQTAAVAAVGLAVAARPLKFVYDGISAALTTVKGKFVDAASGETTFLKAGTSLAKGGIIAAGIVEITRALSSMQDVTDKSGGDFLSSLPDVSDISGYTDAVNKAVQEQNALTDELNNQTGPDNGDLGKMGREGAAAFDIFKSAVGGSATGVVELKAKLDGLGSELDGASKKADQLGERAVKIKDDLGVPIQQVLDFVKKFKGLDITQTPLDKIEKAFKEAQQPGADLAAIAEELGVKVNTAADDADTAAKSFNDLHDAVFGLADAQQKAIDATDHIADAERNAAQAADRVTEAKRAQEASVRDVAAARRDEEASVRKVTDAEVVYSEQLAHEQDAVDALAQAKRDLANIDTQQGFETRDAAIRVEQAQESIKNARHQAGDALSRHIALQSAQLQLDEATDAQTQLGAKQQQDKANATKAVRDAEQQIADQHRQTLADQQAITDAVQAEKDARQHVSDALWAEHKATTAVGDAQYDEVQAQKDVSKAKQDALTAVDDLNSKERDFGKILEANNGQLGPLLSYLQQLEAQAPALAAALAPELAIVALAGGGTTAQKSGDSLGALAAAGSAYQTSQQHASGGWAQGTVGEGGRPEVGTTPDGTQYMIPGSQPMHITPLSAIEPSDHELLALGESRRQTAVLERIERAIITAPAPSGSPWTGRAGTPGGRFG